MSDLHLRIEGRAGRITLTRPGALNALSHEMVLEIEAALEDWTGRDQVRAVVIDAEGDRAFCAGGDLTRLHDTGKAGNFEYGRTFWRDEYRLNARIARYPKPVVTLMQGYVMGGGVGLGCHASHRVVCETTRIALPECSVGLVPDVGGSWLLSKAPGRCGEYLGMTGARMAAPDALYAGFADRFVRMAGWPEMVAALVASGDPHVLERAAEDPGDGPLARDEVRIDAAFGARDAAAIVHALQVERWREPMEAIGKGSPLSVACTVELVRRARNLPRIEAALGMEYRFTSRAASDGDFVEGIRAAIIDKDGAPRWQHASVAEVPPEVVAAMLAPAPGGALDF